MKPSQKILWFSFKDGSHPHAGGAEVVNEQLAKRLVANGHQVTFVVGGYPNAKAEAVHPDGYKIIRVGGRYTLYPKAYTFYRKHLQGWADLVIDEVNTIPFFTKFYVKEPNIIFAHMLCRKIWFYEMPPPISWFGYALEPLYLRPLNDRKVITVSESTKQDLKKVGFKQENIHIISEGITLPQLKKLPSADRKFAKPTLLSLGALRPMKQTMDQLRAFELAKPKIPGLQLAVAGDASGRYGQKVLRAIKNSPYASDITYYGRVSESEKLMLMQRSHAIMVTSVKEGWGLIVSEANSQGTPAVVYDVDGLRDSVRHQDTGLIAEGNTPQYLADAAVTLLTNNKRYLQLRRNAWSWSQNINFEESYLDFIQALYL